MRAVSTLPLLVAGIAMLLGLPQGGSDFQAVGTAIPLATLARPAPAHEPVATAQTRPLRAGRGGLAGATPTPRPPASPLISAFESAGNLRAFIADALQHPAQGGVFYALVALAECRGRQGVDGDLPSDVARERSHAELSQRLAWVNLSERRCASLIPDDLADSRIDDLFALGVAQGDPLVLAYRGWLDAIEQGSVHDLIEAMQRVLASADPALLQWVAAAGSLYLIGGRSTSSPADEMSIRRRLDAWALLPCELGADCSRPDLGAASPCIAAAHCAGGRGRSTLPGMTSATEQDQAALEAELARLKHAVVALDARAALGL